ncbi:MAG: flagellar export chaperone FlgN [Planctomycetota bacterium]|jgi:predicted RNase H-like nuclease (RuvC/YqgF family)
MVASQTQIPDGLIDYLDNQIVDIKQTLHRLDRLRAAVVRRDEGSLEQLMEEVRHETRQKKQMDLEIQRWQMKLASVLGCPPDQVNMTRLCEQLTGQERRIVQEKQATLQRLTRELGNERQGTELLLRECARFTRLLLSSMVGAGNQTRTYTARGREQWNVHCGQMNIKM